MGFVAREWAKVAVPLGPKGNETFSLRTDNYLINPPLYNNEVRGKWIVVKQMNETGSISVNTNENNYVEFKELCLFEDYIGKGIEIEFHSNTLKKMKFSMGRTFNLNVYANGKNNLINGWISQMNEDEPYSWISKLGNEIKDYGKLEINISLLDQKEKLILEFNFNNDQTTKWLLKRSNK